MLEIKFTVPVIPPSVNHYIQHTRSGIHYRTDEAESFAALVAISAGAWRGRRLEAEEVDLFINLGPGQRGDLDNFPKVVLDSLVRCGVIRSDATITELNVRKARAEVASTEITVRGWLRD